MVIKEKLGLNFTEKVIAVSIAFGISAKIIMIKFSNTQANNYIIIDKLQ